MTPEDIISDVERICRKHGVAHLSLFGSYAAGTARPTSDIDFVVRGVDDLDGLRMEIDAIPTLKKIDLFDYDTVRSPELKEDMDLYAKEIY